MDSAGGSRGGPGRPRGGVKKGEGPALKGGPSPCIDVR